MFSFRLIRRSFSFIVNRKTFSVFLALNLIVFLLTEPKAYACNVDEDIEKYTGLLDESIENRKSLLEDYQDYCFFSGDITERKDRKNDIVCWRCQNPPDVHMLWETDIASGDETGLDPGTNMVPEPSCGDINCTNALTMFRTFTTQQALAVLAGAFMFGAAAIVIVSTCGVAIPILSMPGTIVAGGVPVASYATGGVLASSALGGTLFGILTGSSTSAENRLRRADIKIKRTCFRKEGDLDSIKTATDSCQTACFAWHANNKMIELYSDTLADLLDVRDDACGEKLDCEGLEGTALSICECNYKDGYSWVGGNCEPVGGGGDELPEPKPESPPSYTDQDSVLADGSADDYSEDYMDESLDAATTASIDSTDILSGRFGLGAVMDTEEGSDGRSGLLSMHMPEGSSGSSAGPGASKRDTRQRRGSSVSVTEVESEKEELLLGLHEGISTGDESVFDIVYRMHRERYFAGLLDDTARATVDTEERRSVGTQPVIYERRGTDRTTVR